MRDALFVVVPDDLERVLPPVGELRFERGAFGEDRDHGPSLTAPRAVAPATDQTAEPNTLVVVILFGKIHHVLRKEFVERAARYAAGLWLERDLLLDEVRSLQKIERDDPGSFARYLKAKVSGPNSIEASLDALRRVLEGIGDPRPEPHSERLRETGLVLHQVRAKMTAVRGELAARREDSIATAQSAEQYTRLVKDGAFQILLMAPNFIPVMKNPVTEFGYRIAVVMIEATASAGGAAIAGTPVLREIFAVAKERLPSVLVDTFMSVVRGYLGPAAAAARAGSLIFIQQVIEFCFDVVMLGIDGHVGERDGKEVILELAQKRLLSLFGIALGRLLGFSPDDGRVKHLAKLLTESVATVMAQEILDLLKRSKQEGRPVAELVLAELPWLLARVLQNVILGLVRHGRVTPGQVDERKVAPGAASPARDTLKLMYAQARGKRMIFAVSGPAPAAPRPPGVPKAPPLGGEEFEQHWNDLGLSRSALHTMLRSVDDGGTIIEARVSNAAAPRHSAEAGVAFKGEDCKAKTANLGPEAERGLVVRPTAETHRDVAAARAIWDDNVPKLREKGYLVRPDGVLFHPDLLVEWSRSLPPKEKAIVRSLADKLRGPKPDAAFELDSPAGRAWLAEMYPDPFQWADARTLLSRARVGFTGDTDLVQLFDAVARRPVPVGDVAHLLNHPAFKQNAGRLKELNERANSLRRVAEEQETPMGRRGKEPFQHGGAAERFDPDGLLEFPGLGRVYGLARGEKEVVRWTVDTGKGEVSVPSEMVASLALPATRQVAKGRFTTLTLEPSEKVTGRVFAALRNLPTTHRASAREVLVKELGLEHLDAATIDRFAGSIHALVAQGDERRWSVAVQHMDDARTLSLLHRIRESHITINKPLLDKHRAPRAAGEVDAYRRRVQPRPGRLTKIRLQDRPRWASTQVTADQIAEAPPPLEAAIGPRSVEAGLLVRGLTLLARDNRDLFADIMDGAKCDDLAAWLDAHDLALGIDAARTSVVVAARSRGNLGEALRRMGEVARRMGLGGASPDVSWELHQPVVPTTTSHLAGRLDDGEPGITDATRALLSDRLSAAEARPGMRLMAFRAVRSRDTYPPASHPGPHFRGLELDEAWWNERSGRAEFRPVRLVGRPVTVFLGTPVAVPEDGPRITRPLECESLDLAKVRNVQRALKQLGYLEPEPTGTLDPETREAIATFQADADTSLVVDGRPGPKTQGALREALRALELGDEP